MATLPLLEIDLLGPLCVKNEGRTLTRFQTRKTAALLGLMAVRSQRPLRREEVIEMLWPGVAEDAGRNRLRMALTNLRHELETPAPSTVPSRRVIVADRLHVRLDNKAFTTDKARFEALLEQARNTNEDAPRIAWLTEAVELYRGDLLDDFDEPWLMGERQQTADAYLLAVRRLIKALARTQQYDRALHYAQRAVQADPLREETHRSLMQLYAALGRPADALRQYRQMEERLREDLGAAPSSVSQQLHADLHVPASDIVSPAPPIIACLPSSSPSQAAGTVPPPSSTSATLDAVKTAARPTLPVYGTSLLGRHRDVAQVCEMLQTPDTRLVTVTGMGGCGKTRVAISVAQTLLPTFGEHVWFVPLASVQDANLLWDAVAGALSLPNDPTASRQQQVVSALSGEPGLLVLDNCEHLGEEASRWVADLLQAVPPLTCLATSRQRLNVSSEYEYGLAPLSIPAATSSPADILLCPSVQLFIDRARRVRPIFAVTQANAPVLAALCQCLDGLPLAIELAAAWTQTLTLAQILARLSQRFTLLVSRHHDVPDRHRSLRAVLDGSFGTLSSTVQCFFARLSVFRGGWTLDAAQAVCEEPDALEYLTQLREQSLLTGSEAGEEMRYSWLETVREYACEKLGTEEHTVVRQNHTGFYIGLAARAKESLYGEEAIATLTMLDVEQANFRVALEWGVAHPPLGAQMANSLASFWHIRGYFQEGLGWFSQALEAGESLPSDLRLNTTGNAGNFAYLNANYGAARSCYEACLELATQLGDNYGIAHALDSLGNVAQELGDNIQAQHLLDESISRWRTLDKPSYLALSLSHRAIFADDTGDYDAARCLYEESLALYRSIGRQESIALMLSNLAGVLLKQEDYEAAVPLLEESLKLGQLLSSPRSLALALAQTALLSALQHRYNDAAILLGQMTKVRQEAKLVFNPKSLQEIQELEKTVRANLEHTAFEELWAQGMEMSLSTSMKECL